MVQRGSPVSCGKPPLPHRPPACPICAVSGLVPSGPQGSARVDQRHIPPLAVSHAVFSEAEGPVPCQEPGGPWGCITCTVQPVVRGTLVLSGCRVPQGGPRPNAFPTLVMGGDNEPAIDRSPLPAISASWALFEEEDACLR